MRTPASQVTVVKPEKPKLSPALYQFLSSFCGRGWQGGECAHGFKEFLKENKAMVWWLLPESPWGERGVAAGEKAGRCSFESKSDKEVVGTPTRCVSVRQE